MDALLWELLASGEPDEQIEVLIKLSDLGQFPAGPIEIVAQIGNILSCKIRRGDIETIRNDAAVWSMKASKTLRLDPPIRENFIEDQEGYYDHYNVRRPPDISFTGKGIAIGIADWGLDFTHVNFINPDGTTRFLAIWDQSADYDGNNIYGFGAIHKREEINSALCSDTPFQELNYHPGLQDIFQQGMHGTHVLDIAAGNGTVGESGIAPNADIVGVHLFGGNPSDLMGLGTSARVFDAIHFLDKTVGETPLVINMSMGGHGDAHAGLSLIEQAVDQLIKSKDGRAVVQSCGNYFGSRTHTNGFITKDEEVTISWLISEHDKASNEIEIWYEPLDEIEISLFTPSGVCVLSEERIGKAKIFEIPAIEVGRYYHREKEPSTNLNQVEIILDETASRGKWKIILKKNSSTTIRYHTWIERNNGSSANQSRFSVEQSTRVTTTGSICNGFHSIAVGAINDHKDQIKIGSFSSVGPTWDGRQKPDLTAPGVGIKAAKSAAAFEERSSNGLVTMSGTSMAAPVVTGAIALLYEASEKLMSISEVKEKLFSACEQVDVNDENEKKRYGVGNLKIEKLFNNSFDFNAGLSSMDIKKQNIMQNLNFVNPPIESLFEISQNEFPDLNSDNLSEYFQSLPPLQDALNNSDIKRGDILIRRQYGHIVSAWYGVVDFVHENEIFLLTLNGKKKITTPIQKWEWKKLRPDYYNERNTQLLFNDAVDKELSPLYSPIISENNFDEDFYGEDADTSIANLSTFRKGAAKNQINTIYQRISSATCLKHPGLPNNPLIGVTDEMIKVCYNAFYMHGAISKPEVLMAFWKKEGSDKQASVKAFGTSGVNASSAENAIAIFRSNTYYLEMGMDVLIHFTAVTGSDNAANISDSNAKDHELAFKNKIDELVKTKYLSRNLVNDINSSLNVQVTGPGLYAVNPSSHFYIYSLLVMDALLRYHEDQLKKVIDYGGIADIGLIYMHWNMRESSFIAFIKSANKHRKESKYLVNGNPISLIDWAFNRCPIAGEFDQSRSNAIKVRYFVEIFKLVFDDSSGGALSESTSATPVLYESVPNYSEDVLIRRGSKSDSAKLNWVAEIASGDNPKSRVYYVVTGAAGNKGAYIEVNVENTNSHYNLQGIYFAMILQWAKNNGGSPIADATTVIQLDKQKGDRKFIKPSTGDEIEDGTTKSFKINIRPDDLKKAYSLLDKANSEIQFEIFCYWYEGVITTNYFFNSIKKKFFLVQPIELVDSGEIVDWSFGPDFENITYVIVTKKDGTKTKIEYPSLYNSYEKPLTFLDGVGETDSISISITDIDSSTITSTIKNTKSNTQDETFKFNIGEEFLEGGLKSIVGLGYENKVSESLSKEISTSLSNTKTYQESIGVTNTLTFPSTDEPRQYFAKLVFAAVIVNGFRYSDVNDKGLATKREIIKDPFLIWRPKVWAKYYKKITIPKPRKPTRHPTREIGKTEAWDEGYKAPSYQFAATVEDQKNGNFSYLQNTDESLETVPSGPFGTLSLTRGKSIFNYDFTQEDLIWTAKLITGEASGIDNLDNRAVIWALINKYAYTRHNQYASFQDFIVHYSTTLQPVLNSLRAAKRNMNKKEFVKTGGYYKGHGPQDSDPVPKGQLQSFIDLQNYSWKDLSLTARTMAYNSLIGLIPNPIGNASEFDNTRTYYKQNNNRYPTHEQWVNYTKNFGVSKYGGKWIGEVAGLNQEYVNAFFVTGTDINLPEGSVTITFTGTVETPSESFEEDTKPSVHDIAVQINQFVPNAKNTIVVNMKEFDSNIIGFVNYKPGSGVDHQSALRKIRQPEDITFIVLHESSGSDTGTAFDNTHGTTAHFAITTNAVHQFNDLAETEQHVGKFNPYSIGIEFANSDWVSKKDHTHQYIDAHWDGNHSIYTLPAKDKLEKLVELIQRLLSKSEEGFPLFQPTWLQLISYNDVIDIWDFEESDIPITNEDKQTKFFFIYTSATGYITPEKFVSLNGLFSHDSVSTLTQIKVEKVLKTVIDEDSHTDGSFQALYTWLRLQKNLTSDNAFDTALQLLNNDAQGKRNKNIIKVKTKVSYEGYNRTPKGIFLPNHFYSKASRRPIFLVKVNGVVS
jgi:subtilisin family serine protease